MAEVTPFAGLRFTAPLSDVIAPPFDVISPEERDALYDHSPYNVVRLELGREADPYAEAARCFGAWRKEGALRQDSPSFYLYEQRFAGKARRGVIGRVKLEPWEAGVVLPHEATHGKAKEDRLQLLRSIKANVSPVFGLYEDPGGALRQALAAVASREPDASGTDSSGEQHALWRIDGPDVQHAIRSFFAGKQLFIADGHHRYETALAYRDEAETEAARFVMMVLVDFADPGLIVQPTHRLLHGLSSMQRRRLADGLGEYFEVTAAAESPSPKALAAMLAQLEASPVPAFALYGSLPGGLRLLALKPEWRGHTFDPSHSAAWNALDVSIIHAIFGNLLELSPEDVSGQRYFRYIQEPPDAIRQVQAEEAQLALLLRPTPAMAIRDVALARDKMPQKSTYFYPKLATGLVINPLQ